MPRTVECGGVKKTRRFERQTKTESAFWQIEQDGVLYLVRWGALGTEGQVREQRCESVEEARAQIDRLSMNLADLKFTEVGGVAEPGSLPWSSEFEAAILREPENVGARQVYGDWLQLNGNPLGELVALQGAGIASGAQADAMFESMFGAVAKNFRTRHSQRPGERGLELKFHNGFVDSIWCGSGETKEAKAALDAVLSSPASRFVRSVTLGLTEYSSQGLIETLVRHAPRLIERLEVADFDYTYEATMGQANTGNLHRIWAAMPSLQKVVTRGGGYLELGEIIAPGLRSFTVETSGLDTTALNSILGARWPSLERLKVWLGDGFTGSLDDLQPIFAGGGLTKLEHFGLMNSTLTNSFIAALARSKMLKQLRTLNLSLGTLTDEGVAELATHRKAFAHLEAINLRDNLIEDLDAANALGLPLTLNSQRSRHSEGDFPAVGP